MSSCRFVRGILVNNFSAAGTEKYPDFQPAGCIPGRHDGPGGTLQTDGNVEICVGSGIQRTDDRTLSFCTEVFRTRGYGRLCKRLK